ncbi:MAG TPA: trimethylamine methyltransferase family protein [Acidobacteriota bacterium]|nr:trimethylamine methyltransferase family protein [Acidobacteriota bacterium]
MPEPMLARPILNLLSADQIQLVHRGALKVLEHTGLIVESERARNVYAKAGDSVSIDDIRVKFKPDVVEWAIKAAPATYDVYNRSGEKVFTLGDSPTRFGNGVTNLFYQDPVTDEVSHFTRKHMEMGVRLAQSLNEYDVISTLGVLRDMPPQVADLYAVLEMVANSTKPLVLLISDEKLFPRVLELIEHIHGDVGDRPFIIPYLNPVTPLKINEGTSDKLLDSIEHGIAAIFSNYGMAGMSTPITPAGALTFLNAELLAGVVLSQLAKEGAPIICGSLPAYFDMKTMVDFMEMQSFLINLGCAEMMAHYGIPHAGTSGSGEGWSADLLAAGTNWTNHLTSLMGKSGLAPFVGSGLNSKVYMPTQTVYANDVIAQARFFAQGFPVDERTVGADEIIYEMKENGHFLMSESTLAVYQNAYFQGIFPRISLEKWEELGNPKMEQLLRDRTVELLSNQEAPEDHDEIIRRGEEFLR